MSGTTVLSVAIGYTLGLLNRCTSVQHMVEKGFLPVGRQQTCRHLAGDPHPHRQALARRLSDAPTGFFLAGGLLTVRHEGPCIEGVGRHDSSAMKGMFWGHTFTSSALVAPGEDPYGLRCDPFLDARMATTSPLLSPSEALLNVVGDVVVAGHQIAGVLADAHFATRLTLRSLNAQELPSVMRFRTNAKVLFEAELVSVRELAERYSPGWARWYQKLRRYVKRVSVVLPEVGMVDLLLVWKRQGTGWYLTALVSTLEAGVQGVLAAWNAHSQCERDER